VSFENGMEAMARGSVGGAGASKWTVFGETFRPLAILADKAARSEELP
jgi:hypothetical protein